MTWDLDEPQNVKALVMAMHRKHLGKADGQDFFVQAPKLEPVQGTTQQDWPNRPWGQRVPFL
jgi:hypothetical protein